MLASHDIAGNRQMASRRYIHTYKKCSFTLCEGVTNWTRINLSPDVSCMCVYIPHCVGVLCHDGMYIYTRGGRLGCNYLCNSTLPLPIYDGIYTSVAIYIYIYKLYK